MCGRGAQSRKAVSRTSPPAPPSLRKQRNASWPPCWRPSQLELSGGFHVKVSILATQYLHCCRVYHRGHRRVFRAARNFGKPSECGGDGTTTALAKVSSLLLEEWEEQPCLHSSGHRRTGNANITIVPALTDFAICQFGSTTSKAAETEAKVTISSDVDVQCRLHDAVPLHNQRSPGHLLESVGHLPEHPCWGLG